MWVSSVKLVFNSNDLSLHHFLSSYFQIQRGESLLSPGSAVPKLGCMLESIRKYYMFWCPGTPRPVKSEALEVGSRHWLFLTLPSDSMMHPSLRTSALVSHQRWRVFCTHHYPPPFPYLYSSPTSFASCIPPFKIHRSLKLSKYFPSPCCFSSNHASCLLLFAVKCVEDSLYRPFILPPSIC